MFACAAQCACLSGLAKPWDPLGLAPGPRAELGPDSSGWVRIIVLWDGADITSTGNFHRFTFRPKYIDFCNACCLIRHDSSDAGCLCGHFGRCPSEQISQGCGGRSPSEGPFCGAIFCNRELYRPHRLFLRLSMMRARRSRMSVATRFPRTRRSCRSSARGWGMLDRSRESGVEYVVGRSTLGILGA